MNKKCMIAFLATALSAQAQAQVSSALDGFSLELRNTNDKFSTQLQLNDDLGKQVISGELSAKINTTYILASYDFESDLATMTPYIGFPIFGSANTNLNIEDSGDDTQKFSANSAYVIGVKSTFLKGQLDKFDYYGLADFQFSKTSGDFEISGNTAEIFGDIDFSSTSLNLGAGASYGINEGMSVSTALTAGQYLSSFASLSNFRGDVSGINNGTDINGLGAANKNTPRVDFQISLTYDL